MSRNFKTSKKDQNQYIFYFADGSKNVLQPGVGGLTESEIALLHQMDRDEYNNDYKAIRHQVSFDAYIDDDWDKNGIFIDRQVDIEGDFISMLDESDKLQNLMQAMDQLLPQQRELLRKVFWEKHSLTALAKSEGVSLPTIHERIKRAKNKLKNIISETPNID